MKLLVCGSRDYADYRTIDEVLDGLHRNRPISQLIEGGALGADRFARYWANNNNIPVWTFDAEWERYKQAAGPIRNTRMLREGRPDLVVAFLSKPLERSKGTANMVAQAHRAKVQVSIIER
jgi:hypothetical protein